MLSSTDKLVLRFLAAVDGFDRRRSAPQLDAENGAEAGTATKALAAGSTVAGRYKLVAMLGEGSRCRVTIKRSATKTGKCTIWKSMDFAVALKPRNKRNT